MAAKSFKNPPPLGSDTVYETWKNEVEIWQKITDLDKKKQALAVTLSLSGQAREKALQIKADDLNKDDGMTTLINALDSLYKRETIDLSYEAYMNFDKFKKMDSMNMVDYIVEFERLYTQCVKYEMQLPNAVLAFKLLDSCNLSQRDRQLALTASSDLSFDNMKSALKRIFGGTGKNETNSGNGIEIKNEAAMWVQKKGIARKGKFNAAKKKATNPLDKSGKPTKCAICQSLMHWARDCPHRYDEEEAKMTKEEDEHVSEVEMEGCNLTLLTAHEIFVVESKGAAVIDTACTKTVCGEKWFKDYMTSLSLAEKRAVKTQQSKRPFKFGDGKVVYSIKLATIPAHIADRKCNIETEVVSSDIPLLLSKSSLKKAGAVLDLKNDQAELFNKKVKLELTSSGHYCIDIVSPRKLQSKTSDREEEVLVITSDMSPNERKKILLKLHQQFGHASVDRLVKLIQSAGYKSVDVTTTLEDIVENCEICKTHKKTPPKPAVSLPLARDFNDTVAVDLHQLEDGLWYLHAIDLFSRFSAGCLMRTKRSSEFVKQFLNCWISIHGTPKTLFHDNGGEFNNEEVRDMAENFNISVKTTAAYSPWSNGLLERHNKTLTEMLLKIREENKCDWEVALSWALMAKNALHNIHGYSSYQLVYGKNPSLPNVLTDEIPALEGCTSSIIVGAHIRAMYTARKAFTEAECSERIRRALRKNIRSSKDTFVTGDKVYYKKHDCPKWKGPGTVIGQDSTLVFIRHGGTYVRVHLSRVQRATSHAKEATRKKEELQPMKRQIPSQPNEKHEYLGDSDDSVGIHDDQSSEIGSNNGTTNRDDIEGDQWEDTSLDMPSDTDVSSKHELMKLKPGQIITFVEGDTESRVTGQVLGRAAKATGKLKHWYNVEYHEPKERAGIQRSVDLSTVYDFKIKSSDPENDENTSEDVMIINENSVFEEAKQTELDNWKSNEVYEVVKDVGQNFLTTRWVCTLKQKKTGVTPKARLVARGFEDADNENVQRDSPTCSAESLRAIHAVLCQNNWKAHSMDIKTAFLQGEKMTRTVYIKPPKEAKQSCVLWKLQKCVYGLVDASLSWYKRVCRVMSETGAKTSAVDPAVFYWLSSTGSVEGILASHVDDFIWGGTPAFEKRVIAYIRSCLYVGKEEEDDFNYIGIEIKETNGNVLLSQKNYVDNMQYIKLDSLRRSQKTCNVTETELNTLQSKIGQLLWMGRQSRPDILYDVCNLASSLKNATVENLIETNKVIRKIKSEAIQLKYQKLGKKEELKLLVFSDASLGNLADGGTQGGNIIFLQGTEGKCSPISWKSKRIRRVVRSTLAAETVAMTEALDDALYISTLFTELMNGCTDAGIKIVCITDNKSLHDAIKSNKFVSEKRLRIDISNIKELVEKKQVQQVLWSANKLQLADCLTKRGASSAELLKTLQTGICEY